MNRESVMAMDPNILLSLVNMKLRDNFSSLEALCEDLNVREEELIEKLRVTGYNYIKEINQFR